MAKRPLLVSVVLAAGETRMAAIVDELRADGYEPVTARELLPSARESGAAE